MDWFQHHVPSAWGGTRLKPGEYLASYMEGERSMGCGIFNLLDPALFKRGGGVAPLSREENAQLIDTSLKIKEVFAGHGFDAAITEWAVGPSCITYYARDIRRPDEAVRHAMEDAIAAALEVPSVRIGKLAPRKGVGVEVARKAQSTVLFGDLANVLRYDAGKFVFPLGVDSTGKPVYADLAELHGLLIAGDIRTGKTTLQNAILMSLLAQNTPDNLRLVMIDPKQVEFAEYNGVPHLAMPVITDMRQAVAALQWGVAEAERRREAFERLEVRDLTAYNSRTEERLPRVVFFIDELLLPMLGAWEDVEASIARIAQLGGACGIYLVIATQYPRADTMTDPINGNVANRIAVRTYRSADSKFLLGETGAERLLRDGDMLFLDARSVEGPRRIKGCYVSNEEVRAALEFLKTQTPATPWPGMAPLPDTQPAANHPDNAEEAPARATDDHRMAWEAAQIIVENQLGSTSMIQRRLKLGYARAGRVMDMLEEMGVVGPARGSKPRDVLIRDLDELATLRGRCDESEESH